MRIIIIKSSFLPVILKFKVDSLINQMIHLFDKRNDFIKFDIFTWECTSAGLECIAGFHVRLVRLSKGFSIELHISLNFLLMQVVLV